MLSSLPCFYAFCWSAIPTSCYIFNVFYSCLCHFFFSSRCMLELKFAIHQVIAASLPSQAFYAVLAEESLAFFKHSPHTNSISNSAIHFVVKWFVHMHTHEEKNGVVKEAIVLQWAVRITLCDFEPGKSDRLVHCSVKNAAVLCENHRERVMQIWTSPSEEKEEEEEEEEERKKKILAVWRLSVSVLLVLLRCFLAPLCVFFVMKTRKE